ncbi:intraflagellar transport protein 27 homolog [Watersipora subatra]|uniref:intraflagellar transport protein 27 homolog n=1 Tax=Watersipora subatra TaxID=2589382 RepID=UPI00355B7BD3
MSTIVRAKLVVVGDSCSGKSAITQVFHSDGAHYPKNYSMTVGVELVVKSVVVPETTDSVELYIYDSSGKEVFAEQVQRDWDHPSLLMAVYDCTSDSSFNSCSKWIERVRTQKPEMNVPGVLVANKVDLTDRRVVSPKSGELLAQQLGLEYFEVSAKDSKNVEAPFQHLANEFYKLYKERVEFTSSLVI